MIQNLLIFAAIAAASLVRADVGKVPLGTEVPAALKDVGIDQKLGAQLPLDAEFDSETGGKIRFGQLLGKRPVILALVYYECPMLCTMVLNGTLRSLRALRLNAGTDFDVVAVSFDPEETPQLAAKKKLEYTERYKRPGGEAGWHFITGDTASIKKVADAAGFRFKKDTTNGRWAHASAIMVVTPDGRLARYFLRCRILGPRFAPRSGGSGRGQGRHDGGSDSAVLLPLRSVHGQVQFSGAQFFACRGCSDSVRFARLLAGDVPRK
jgi:cytochrome oxidase Cu insertion factor (SCO1/SenC/PrrC family)